MDEVLDKLKIIERKTSNELLVISDLTKLILESRMTKAEVTKFLENFIKIFYNKNRSIIFPSFISPNIKRDVINLDTEKSITGILSEIFRNLKNVKRTQNPYFSYSILGKEQKTFININPLYEWSSKSHLGWMEKKNVSCIILGSYPANNPLVHRVEYKNKALIKYREFKKHKNNIISQNQNKIHTQFYFGLKKGYDNMNKHYINLFNRREELEIDDLTLNNFSIFHYRAKVLFDLYEDEIKNNEIFQVGIRLTS